MIGEASDSDCDGKDKASKDDWKVVPKIPWAPASDAAIFKEVRLRQRLAPASGGITDGQLASSKAQLGPINRSYCTVRLEPCEENNESAGGTSVFEFRLGERCGYQVGSTPSSLMGKDPWHPPINTSRIDIAPWVTIAVFALSSAGSSAEFEADDVDSELSGISRGGLVGRVRVTLLQLVSTSDLLADDGIVLRVLESGVGEVKPRDLAQVKASWKVWFVRNGELIMSTSAEDGGRGTEFVLDEVQIIVALQLALKEMEVGSRACLRVSEEWGSGSLSPLGNPVLRGAAVWMEIRLISTTNEPAPGEHSSVSDALAFAVKKKEQGNASIKDAIDWSRAVRRYEVGIRTLEAVLPQARHAATGSKDGDVATGPVAEERDLPAVRDCLAALRLNAAQGELKRQHWKNAIAFCDAVLSTDSGHAKARYRRGLARLELAQLDGTIEDFRVAIATNPADAFLRKELVRAETLRKEQRAAEKKAFGGVFDKMIHEEEQIRKREEEEAKVKTEIEAKEKLEASAKAKSEAGKFWGQVEEAKAAEFERRRVEGEVEEANASSEVVEGFENSVHDLAAHDEVCNNYLMPPPNFERRVVEKPTPINYQVPSFLKQSKAKKSVS